jgi:Ser/Thr protein kinase RdoA (MazF antagonist)
MQDVINKTEIANAAVSMWNGVAGSLQHISNSAAQVYSFSQSGITRYLRLTSSRNKTKSHIEAELDFISYLRRGGVSAMLPISSAAGKFIEEIAFEGDTLFACVFEEAEGERFRYDSTKPDEEHFKLRGRTVGQIHALAKNYIPTGRFRRFAWDEDKLLSEADRFLPKSEKQIWRSFDGLKERLQDYAKSNQTYGLIHGDFGETNYRCRDGRLNIFDFDDSCYHWFVYDISIMIYPHGWRREGLKLLDWLLEGYSERMRLSTTLEEVTIFCQWRLLYMFLIYARKWGFKNLSEQQATWFEQKRENIARGYAWHL